MTVVAGEPAVVQFSENPRDELLLSFREVMLIGTKNGQATTV